MMSAEKYAEEVVRWEK